MITKENLIKAFKQVFTKAIELSDGVSPDQLQISDKSVGGKVELKNDDGTLAPIPDGDYTDADGVQFTVKDGFITVWDGQTEADMADATAPDPADAQTEDAEDKGFADMQAAIKALQDETNNIKQILADLIKADQEEDANEAKEGEQMAAFSKQLSELTEAIKVIANTPAEFSKTSTNNIVKDNKQVQLEEFAKMFSTKN